MSLFIPVKWQSFGYHSTGILYSEKV